jgi:hypothetical protein
LRAGGFPRWREAAPPSSRPRATATPVVGRGLSLVGGFGPGRGSAESKFRSPAGGPTGFRVKFRLLPYSSPVAVCQKVVIRGADRRRRERVARRCDGPAGLLGFSIRSAVTPKREAAAGAMRRPGRPRPVVIAARRRSPE